MIAPGEVHGYGLTATDDGNFIFYAGASAGFGSGLEAGSYIVKVDPTGSIVWMNKFSDTIFSLYKSSILEAPDGGYLIKSGGEVFKINDNFEEEWSTTITIGSGTNTATSTIKKTSDGNYLLSGYEQSIGGTHAIRKLDADFNVIWNLETDYPIGVNDVIELSNGDFIGVKNVFVTKLDSEGNIIWESEIVELQSQVLEIFVNPNGGYGLLNIADPSVGTFYYQVDVNGLLEYMVPVYLPFEIVSVTPFAVDDGIVFSGQINNAVGPGSSVLLAKIDWEGILVWENQFELYPGDSEFGSDIYVNSENEIFGMAKTNNPDQLSMYKASPSGQVLPFRMSGNITFDTSEDCLIDSAEPGLGNWIVGANDGNNVQYRLTDETGAYQIDASEGDYTVSAYPPNSLWEPCFDQIPVSLSESTPDSIINIPIQATTYCPVLAVNTSFPVARPCFDNNVFYVQYCNEGTITATDPYIEIEIDSSLSVVSSTIPLVSNLNNILTFDLNDVAIGECGSFQIVFMVDCDTELGETVCLSSQIYPSDSCIIANDEWDGAFVEVELDCIDDEVVFRIENTGLANMSSLKNYVIVEDDILLMENDFQLEIMDVQEFTLPANGATYHLIAEQVDYAPGDSFPTAWIEGCTTGGSSSFSVGFLNQFSLGDNEPNLDSECRITSLAYDPNDKQGIPLGYGSSNYVRPDGKIEYRIRFQNTGTDTAFNVVILDTLSQYLDVSTFKRGVASHPYNVNMNSSNILEFTFPNIMLPDSNVNLPGSNGFVKFEIDMLPGLEDGTVIYNEAAIYFDYNDPIFTNETFHTIGLDFIMVDVQQPSSPASEVLVYPNPFHTQTRFQLNDMHLKDGSFELKDLQGKEVYRQTFIGNAFEFSRGQLQSGIYFFNITEKGTVINSGKIIIQ